MVTYHITEGPASRGEKVRDSFVFTAIWLLGFSALERLANGRWGHPAALAVGGAVCFLGGVLTSYLWPRDRSSFDLEIDDYEIRMVWSGKVVRRARRDRVRYAGERSGIFGTKFVVSERRHGKPPFGGCVAIPKRLLQVEQYERIKSQILGWLENSER